MPFFQILCLRQIALASEIDRYLVDPGAAFPGVEGPEAEIVFREFVWAHSVSVENLEPNKADLLGAEGVFLAGEIGNAVVFEADAFPAFAVQGDLNRVALGT